MTLTKTDTAESQFNEFGWHNREARKLCRSVSGMRFTGYNAPLSHGVSVAVAGVRLFVLTLMSALLVGCGGDSDSAADTAAPQEPSQQEQSIQSIEFAQPGPFDLVVGDTLSNVASGGPGTGEINYSSSDTIVATVDAAGRLTVVGIGTATITAEKAADANYTAASANYVVSATPVPQDPGPEPQSIGFDQPGPLYLMVGDTLSNVASGGLGTGVISYSSSNTTVATVDPAGQLTVVGIGTAEITAEKAADANYTAASASYTVNAPSRVPVTAWVGSENALVQVDLPLSTSGMQFFRSNEANCDLSNVASCANGRSDIVYGGETVEDIAFTLNQTAYYTLQYGANQASLEVSTDERFTNANNADFSPRDGHQVVVHNKLLWVIGGYDHFLPDLRTNDVWWSEDGVTWTEVERTGTRFSARNAHQVAVYDDKLWVIGGWDGSALNNEVWSSEDGVTWTEVERTGRRFSARSNHKVAVHEGKLWVIGGYDDSTDANGDPETLDDVWSSEDGENWTMATEDAGFAPNGQPQQVVGHQVVSYDGHLWVFGASFAGVWWSENGKRWEKKAENICKPDYVPDPSKPEEKEDDCLDPPRRHHIQAVVHGDYMWVMGGGNMHRNDVWRSQDGVTWENVVDDIVDDNPGFRPRTKNGFVSYNDQLWVIGGSRAGTLYNDVWRSEDGVNWRLGFHDVFQFQ